ncbi:MAG: DUF721 domain-containing protein [Candidatus Hydrogenedentota bacterium]|nr:MAG: DUF721 domain-containing protein [Candidatus Hydrogenedentota bacterium]
MDTPKKLSLDDIAPFLEKLGIQQESIQESEVLQTIQIQWNNLVPERLAKNTIPVILRDGVLMIEVKNPAYAQELAWHSGQIIQKLQRLGIFIEKVRTKQRF